MGIQPGFELNGGSKGHGVNLRDLVLTDESPRKQLCIGCVCLPSLLLSFSR